jgi:uncharacterized protein (DUF1800 family)
VGARARLQRPQLRIISPNLQVVWHLQSPGYQDFIMNVRLFIPAVGLLFLGLTSSGPRAVPPLAQADLQWLDRVTFGIDSATVARYRLLGRAKYLEEQLKGPAADPPELSAGIAGFSITQRTPEQLVRFGRDEQTRIRALRSEIEQAEARTAFNLVGAQANYELRKRHLMRALQSPTQLREQMVWFWMNHFSVYAGKANLRWTIGEFEDQRIRPNALGHFRDLVMATVTAPAMLEYLDNAQSAVGRINENYARELMELHVLGVSGGPSGSNYTQADVQELARVLTGLGLNFTDNVPKFPPNRQPLYVRRGLFEFNPARHDFGAKTILNHAITAEGLPEIEQAVTLLCQQPATARFISRKLATYFVADDPPPALIEAMIKTFQRSDGDIAAVLRTMFMAKTFNAVMTASVSGSGKFKDPMQFVMSSLRLAYDGKAILNYRPVIGWLGQLGEPLYGRVTPDGYELTEAGWTSSGQMVKRFEIARAIGGGAAGLFNTDDNKPGPTVGFPMLNNRLFYEAIDPVLSARTRDALARTASQQEWNTLLLASPDWMQR